MRARDIRLLYEYNTWANARILKQAAKVSEAQLNAPARLSHGSLRGTLIHILITEWLWRVRCQEGDSPTSLLSANELPTLAAIQQRWQIEDSLWHTFVTGLWDEDIQRIVRYTTTRGTPYENPLWQILEHVVNHGTQFRSEAGMQLTDLGYSPGDIDFICFIRDRLPD
jgi:uncharacterized damage-inducible protein DinB